LLEIVFYIRIKCAILLILSIITRMALYASRELFKSLNLILAGRLVIKSMLICSQGLLGIGRGYSKPYYLPWITREPW
jgi:hypothetical protein